MAKIMMHIEKGSALKTCALVCRSWYSIASEMLWNKKFVILDCNGLHHFPKPFSQVAQEVKKLQIKTADLKLYERNDMVTGDFVHVLTECNKLENLTITLCDKSSISIINNLACLKEGVLPCLKRLHFLDEKTFATYEPQYIDDPFASLCVSLWLKFSNTLTELDLTYLNNTFALKQYGGLYHYLLNFSNLQHVHIHPQYFNRELMDIDLPLLIRSNKKLEAVTADSSCRFITTTTDDTKLSAVETRGDVCRVIKMIDVYSLEAINFATVSYIVEEELKIKPAVFFSHPYFKATEVYLQAER